MPSARFICTNFIIHACTYSTAMVGNVARIRTCYISSPAGTNLERVRAALIRRNINVVVPEEFCPVQTGPSRSRAILAMLTLSSAC